MQEDHKENTITTPLPSVDEWLEQFQAKTEPLRWRSTCDIANAYKRNAELKRKNSD